MPFLCFCCCNNVIDKGCCSPLVDHVSEEVVHHGLEGCRRVSEPEVHDCKLIYFYVGHKSSLLFISLLNPNIIVAPSQIQLCEHFLTSHPIQDIGDQW